MVKKAPRRTAERILEVTLELFNRFGEPNVSTTLLSAELGISPGNLYYHYPAKDTLINALFDRYEQAMTAHLANSAEVHDVDNAWCFVQTLLDLVWDYRFLYRDLNDLLSKNRRLETHFQSLLTLQMRALRQLLEELREARALHLDASDVPACATSMVVLLSYWLNFEYTCAPRQAQEPHSARLARARGVHQVLLLLQPYLSASQRMQWQLLVRQHLGSASSAAPMPAHGILIPQPAPTAPTTSLAPHLTH